MEAIFIKILNMSLGAVFAVLFVLILRQLFKRAPKIYSYALWAIVFFKLIVPVSIESDWSLMPIHSETISTEIGMQKVPEIHSGRPVVDQFVNQSLPPADTAASINPMQVIVGVLMGIWMIGAFLLLAYSLFSWLRLKRQLREAKPIINSVCSTHLRDAAIQFTENHEINLENVFLQVGLETPFVFRGNIYLPEDLEAERLPIVLVHEAVHMRRKDPYIKTIAYLTAVVHWFNPFAWLAFHKMSEDMEKSCDEKVIQLLGEDIKAAYAESLLSFGIDKNKLGYCPLAFGESNIKSRIKNILNFKKVSLKMMALIILLIVGFGAGLILTPKTDELDLSFLNPDNNISEFAEADIVRVDQPRFKGYTHLSGKEVAEWIDLIQWQDSKVDEAPDLEPTFIVEQPQNGVKICLYETMPTLVLVTDGSHMRFFDIEEDSYKKMMLKVMSRSYFEPYETERLQTQSEELPIRETDDVNSVLALNEVLDSLFDEIMESPSASSNPEDYIKAHPEAYKEIISYGGNTLIYSFGAFEAGGESGLKGHLMMRACKDIYDVESDEIIADTGQAWYDAFKARAFQLKEEISPEEFEKYYPRSKQLVDFLEGTTQVYGDLTILPDYEYDGQDVDLKFAYSAIAKASRSSSRYGELGAFQVMSIQFHGRYQEENQVKLFVTVFEEGYRLKSDEVWSETGSVIPYAITYEDDGTGKYNWIKIQQSEDGGKFATSIKAYSVMPVSGKEIPGLADKIIQDYGSDDLKKLQRQHLIDHLNRYGQKGVYLVHSYDDERIPLN